MMVETKLGVCPRCDRPLDDHTWRVWLRGQPVYLNWPRCPE